MFIKREIKIVGIINNYYWPYDACSNNKNIKVNCNNSSANNNNQSSVMNCERTRTGCSLEQQEYDDEQIGDIIKFDYNKYRATTLVSRSNDFKYQ